MDSTPLRCPAHAHPQGVVAGGPQQPVAAVPRQQLVTQLLLGRHPAGQQVRWEQPIGQVVHAAVALTPRDREDPRLGQRLEQRADLIGGPPVPVDGRPRLDVGRRQRAVGTDAVQQLLDQGRVVVERAATVLDLSLVPGDPVPGQLRGRHQRQLLVVRLVQHPVAVQEVLGPLAPVAVDPRQQRQVVVAARDLEGVELERPEPVDDPHHGRRPGGQRARRGEQVALDEEPPRGLGGHLTGLGAHAPIVGLLRDWECQVSPNGLQRAESIRCIVPA